MISLSNPQSTTTDSLFVTSVLVTADGVVALNLLKGTASNGVFTPNSLPAISVAIDAQGNLSSSDGSLAGSGDSSAITAVLGAVDSFISAVQPSFGKTSTAQLQSLYYAAQLAAVTAQLNAVTAQLSTANAASQLNAVNDTAQLS